MSDPMKPIIDTVRAAGVEIDRLRAVNADLLTALETITNGMERVAEALPSAVRYMPGLEWMPKEARAAIKKARGE